MLCARKKKWNAKEEEKKILRKSVTKTEKSRYRDEFFIRWFKRSIYMSDRFLPKKSSKLSRLFVAIIFLIFFTKIFIFL